MERQVRIKIFDETKLFKLFMNFNEKYKKDVTKLQRGMKNTNYKIDDYKKGIFVTVKKGSITARGLYFFKR